MASTPLPRLSPLTLDLAPGACGSELVDQFGPLGFDPRRAGVSGNVTTPEWDVPPHNTLDGLGVR